MNGNSKIAFNLPINDLYCIEKLKHEYKKMKWKWDQLVELYNSNQRKWFSSFFY